MSANPTITRRSDGRYQTTIGVDGRRIWIYGASKNEVLTKYKALRTQKDRGVLRAPTHKTLADFLAWWLDNSRSRLKATTHAHYTELVRLHIAPALGSTKIEAVSPAQLAELYSRKLEAGLSPQRVKLIHSCLRTALNCALRLDIITSNPCIRVDPPKVEKIEPELWDDAELRRFVDVQMTSPSRWAPCWLLLLGSGLRLGEALGLLWQHVDLDRGTVEVRQALTFVNRRPNVSSPKTRSSKRVLVLPRFAVEALRAHKRRQDENQRRAGATWPDRQGFVFLSETGTHPVQRNLLTRFHEACRRAGVRQLRIHDLRHEHASILLDRGASVKQVQVQLGHSSAVTTMGTYAHLVRRGDDYLARQLDEAFG